MGKSVSFLFGCTIICLLLLTPFWGCNSPTETNQQELIVGSWVPDSVIADMDTTRIQSSTIKQGMAIMQKTKFTFFADSLIVSNPKRKQKGVWKIIPEQKTITTKWAEDTTTYHLQYDTLTKSLLVISNKMGFGSFTTYYRKIKE